MLELYPRLVQNKQGTLMIYNWISAGKEFNFKTMIAQITNFMFTAFSIVKRDNQWTLKFNKVVLSHLIEILVVFSGIVLEVTCACHFKNVFFFFIIKAIQIQKQTKNLLIDTSFRKSFRIYKSSFKLNHFVVYNSVVNRTEIKKKDSQSNYLLI